MFTKKFFFNFVALIIAVFLIGIGAGVDRWLFWFDDILHFAGGMAVAVGASLFFARELSRGHRKLFLVVFIAGTSAIIGIGWEIMEWFLDHTVFAGSTFRNQPGLTDTVSDLVLDTSGGLLVALIYLKSKSKILRR